jgi:DinB family protein
MQAKDALKIGLTSTQNLVSWYVGDLTDQELTVRPVPNANNIAWQLGHLIEGEVFLGSPLPGAAYPELPAFLKGQYDKKTANSTPPGGYLTKNQYLEWFNKVRAASIANVDKLSDADLDKPNTGGMAKFAPLWADLIVLLANHTLMHAGQFTVVRRALNKPVLF